MSEYTVSSRFVRDLLPVDFLPDKPLERRLSKYIKRLVQYNNDLRNCLLNQMVIQNIKN